MKNITKMYFKDYKELREKHNLEVIKECTSCNKKFELNSGVFIRGKGQIICKECYKKYSKQERA